MVKIWRTSKWNLLIRPIANQNESEHSILTKIILFVSANIHKTRQKTLIDCVKSLASGSSPSVNSIDEAFVLVHLRNIPLNVRIDGCPMLTCNMQRLIYMPPSVCYFAAVNMRLSR